MPKMAYVLGFFVADGNLTINPRGSRYIEFSSCDKEIIEKRKYSNHTYKMGRWCSLVNTFPCHGKDRGFKSLPARQISNFEP